MRDWIGFSERLGRSQLTGPSPTEQWVAQQRVALIVRNYSYASAEVLARHEHDLRC